MLEDGIANNILLGSAVRSLLVLLGGEHVSDLGVVGSGILHVSELGLGLIG